MHTVELLNAAVRCAEELGIHVREDWLDGASGGECEIDGQRWLFLDLSQSPQERLAAVATSLAAYALEMDSARPDGVGEILPKRSAA